MASKSGGKQPCKFFANNACSNGSRCPFSHERISQAGKQPCRFFLQGECGYGNKCLYDHVRPKKEEKRVAASSSAKPSRPASSLPRPAQLPREKPLSADAPAFTPSWLKKPAGSYASAAAVEGCDSDVIWQGGGPSRAHVPICPYYEVGECPHGDDCRLVHGDVCEYCNRPCLHPDDEHQRARHHQECLREHTTDMEIAFAEARSEGKQCGICMEDIRDKGLRFGILDGCAHCFCITCIREWRGKQTAFEKEVVRSCPECRQHSHFVIPSIFWVDDPEEKTILFQTYHENTTAKPCRYYMTGNYGDECPFGNKCFYKHQMPDGSIDPGREPHQRRRPQLSEFIFGGERTEAVEEGPTDGERDREDEYAAIIAQLRVGQ